MRSKAAAIYKVNNWWSKKYRDHGFTINEKSVRTMKNMHGFWLQMPDLFGEGSSKISAASS
jgi:hypothetical protein